MTNEIKKFTYTNPVEVEKGVAFFGKKKRNYVREV